MVPHVNSLRKDPTKQQRAAFLSAGSLTGFVVVCEVRAKVVEHVVESAPLQEVARLPEGLLSDLVQMALAQAQVVALVGPQNLLQDVLIIRRVLLHLGTVDEALDLTKEEKTTEEP